MTRGAGIRHRIGDHPELNTENRTRTAAEATDNGIEVLTDTSL